MTAIGLCVLALIITYWAGKRSLGQGVIALLFFGYFFGIIRANLLATFSYFIFDASLLGLYLSQKWSLSDRVRLKELYFWTTVLILWPLLLLVMPFQPWLISLVGLRGCALFIPMLIIGSRLQAKDIRHISVGFVVLNLIALGFATAEYVLGVPRFYPYNAATLIIYNSVDVAQGFHRIPAIFANAHLYGGTMAGSIPYIIGGWEQAQSRRARFFSVLGIGAALLGVLASATRLNFVVSGALIFVTMLNGQMKHSKRFIFAALILALAIVAMANERFQRFKSLSDTDYVEERISGSVNRGFLEILLEYPMGNGLGGGGTSIPYFLEGQVRNPIGLENEYVRILSEQGIVGLLLWIGFITWFLSRYKIGCAKGPFSTPRRLAWIFSVLQLATGAIGLGLLTAIPSSALLLLGIGWTAVPRLSEGYEKKFVGLGRSLWQQERYRPVSHAR